MMLGDILAAAQRSGAGIEEWLKPSDPELWDGICAAAQQEDSDPAGFTRIAVAGFSHNASEDDWAMLISKIRDAEDPGRACLQTMLRWQLAALQQDADRG